MAHHTHLFVQVSLQGEIADLSVDMGEVAAGGNSRGSPIGASAAAMHQTQTANSECLHQTRAVAKTVCETITTEAECTGSTKDTYCDPSVGQQCDGSQCKIVVGGAPDLMQSAMCCSWDDGAGSCGLDTSTAVSSFCEQGVHQVCTDDGGSALNTTTLEMDQNIYTGGVTCDQLSAASLLCNANGDWQQNNVCQLSCFYFSKGYSGDNCAITGLLDSSSASSMQRHRERGV